MKKETPVQLELDFGAAPQAPTRAGASGQQVGGDHYRTMKIQPWDALEAWLTPEEFRGYMKGTVITYLARERAKGGDLDLHKSHHTLGKLLEARVFRGLP